jgi:hypothetical protein
MRLPCVRFTVRRLVEAMAIIVVSDLAFLAGYYGFLGLAYETVVMSHWTPYDDPGYMATGGQ